MPQKPMPELDDVLPENIDRRKFLSGAITSMVAGMAGCTGQGSGEETTAQEGGSGGEQTATPPEEGTQTPQADLSERNIVKNVIFRGPWKQEPNYAPGFAASLRGYWVDENIGGISWRKGFGSGDTTQRVGTGKNKYGMPSVTAVTSGIDEGFNIRIFGTGKSISMQGLIWRTDKLNDGTDLEGKTIVPSTSVGRISLPIYLDAIGVDPNKVTVTEGGEAGAVSLLAKGEIDAVYDTVDDAPAMADTMPDGVELQVTPLYNHIPAYGYMLCVTGDYLAESDENREFTKRVLQGYSKAGKWVMLNPEDAVEFMRNDVNKALQTQPVEKNLDVLKAGVIAVNLSEGVRQNGFGYLDKDVLTTSFEQFGPALEVDSIPSAEEVGVWDIQEEAELAQFSSDEWQQAQENAGRFADWFEY